MKGILGYKLGMTRFYNEAGELVPVTVVQAGPCKVTAVMTQERHGYSALQLGVGNRRTKTMTKPILGHVKAAGFEEKMGPAELREIRLTEDAKQQVGDTVSADIFAEADYVDVTGISKGRGFAGVMKRHHFAGGRDSHGGGWHRRTGSIGMKEHPGRTLKGKRMHGHMGVDRVTQQNLQIVKVLKEENLLYIRGAVPGANGQLVIVRQARKKG